MEQKNPKNPVRIELTEEQRKQLLEQTGQDVDAVELNIEPLEERIAPRSIGTFFLTCSQTDPTTRSPQ